MLKEVGINTLFIISLTLSVAGWFIHIGIALIALGLFIPLAIFKIRAIIRIIKHEENNIRDEKEKDR